MKDTNDKKTLTHINLSRLREDYADATTPLAFDPKTASVEDKENQWLFYFSQHVEDVRKVLNGTHSVLCVYLTWMEEHMPSFVKGMTFSGATKNTYINVCNKTLRAQKFKDPTVAHVAHIRFKDAKDLDKIAKELRADEERSGKALLLSAEPLVIINQNLSKTICKDNILKNVVLMTGLSAYRQNPLNLFLEGPSSTGKTYVVTETLKYFPKEDIWYLGGLSPTALVHDRGEMEEIDGETFKVVELSQKILVFLEKPNSATIEKLLPILSHDVTEIEYRITDKNTKGQHTTLKVLMRGFPAVIFCTTQSEKLQDLSTRNLLYAPEVTEDKIERVLKLQKDAATKPWNTQTTEITFKLQVQEAISMIRNDFNGAEVAIPEIEALNMKISRDPRIMRDYKKRLELIKSCTLLHAHSRISLEYQKGEIEHKVILANFFDILVGLTLYDEIELSTTIGIAPIVIEFFERILKPLSVNTSTFNYREIQEQYYKEYKRVIGSETLRKHRIDPLENAGFVSSDFDEKDKRKRYFYITQDIPTSQITGEKRRIEIGDIEEVKRGVRWLKNTSKIPDVKWYMYRGNLNNCKLSDFTRDTRELCNYLYTPLAIRYYEKLFPHFNKLTKDEISGLFKSPVNAGNSGTKPTEKEDLIEVETENFDGETTKGNGKGGEKESPVNAGTLKDQVAEALYEPTNSGEVRGEISHDKDIPVIPMGAK